MLRKPSSRATKILFELRQKFDEEMNQEIHSEPHSTDIDSLIDEEHVAELNVVSIFIVTSYPRDLIAGFWVCNCNTLRNPTETTQNEDKF